MQIIKRELLYLLRDKSLVFFLILFPLALVFLLGNLLGEMDTADVAIDPISLRYVSEAQGAEAATIHAFIAAIEESGMATAHEAESFADAREAVNAGEAAAALLFTAGGGADAYLGFDSIQNRAVDMMLQSYARSAALAKTLGTLEGPAALAALNAETEGLVAALTLPYNRTMLDYYAVVMLVMILFLGGAMVVSSTFYEGRKDGTLRRIVASPKSRVLLYLQTILSSLPQTALQVAVIMLASTLLFGAKYAATPAHNLLLVAGLLLLGLAVNALFALVGLLLPVRPFFVVLPVLWLMMFLSGTFSKELLIDGVSEYIPVYLVQNAAFELTVYGRPAQMYVLMAISAALLALSTAVGAFIFHKKEVSA